MRTSLVLTFTGIDKPGLVDTLSATANRFGANWEESRMARLAGRFVGIVHLSVPLDHAQSLRDALIALSNEGLTVTAERGVSDDGGSGPPRILTLELIGNDRAGIVQEISHACAQRGVNVEEMMTEREPAPHAGDMLFRAHARLRCPPSLQLEDLHAALERIGNDLMVDISLAGE